MPNIKSITVSLDGNKQVYTAGDEVKGQWTIDVGEELSVRGVRLALKGAAYTRWDNSNPRMSDKIGYEQIISLWTTVFGTKLGEKSSGSHILTAGKHTYKFSFRVPSDRLPSSYEGEYGAIRYWLYLEIDRPIFRFNVTRMKTITILDHIDVNDRQFTSPIKGKVEKKVSKAVVVGNAGTVTLDVQTDRRAYCPGEKIFINLLANNGSDRDLGPIKATLIQHVTFTADRDEKSITTRLQTVTGKQLTKGEKRRWTRQPLTIPAVPHSTMERACQIVKVKYTIKVIVDIPLLNGGDASVTLPVTIGTIPQGHTPRSAGASNSFEIDASAAVTHAECTRGYGVFSEGEKQFPVTTFIPWCTYVPNFKPPVSTPKKPASQRKVTGKTSTSQPKGPEKPSLKQPSASSQTPAQPPPVLPTAPPLLEEPPSYDDVMKEIFKESNIKVGDSGNKTSDPKVADASASGISKTQSTATTSSASVQSNQEVLLVMRFPDKVVDKFRKILTDCPDLPVNQGQLVALAPQVIVSTGSWPQRTSIAMFVFPSKSDATEWFEQASDVFMGNNVPLQDVIIVNTRENINYEKKLFGIGLMKIKQGVKLGRLKEQAALAKQLLTPIRIELGGAIIVTSKADHHLTGNWPEFGRFLVLSQWESFEKLCQYKGLLKTDLYKEVTRMAEENFDFELNGIFQSEDLSSIHEKEPSLLVQDAATTSDDSDNTITETRDTD